MSGLPDLVEKYWRAFEWNAEALWALDLPAEPFPIARLEWILDVPLWPDDGRAYQLTPRQVLRQPHRYASSYRRVREANLMFPIEIAYYKGRWLVLDGVHRMVKAHEMGHEEILVRKVPLKQLRAMSARS